MSADAAEAAAMFVTYCGEAVPAWCTPPPRVYYQHKAIV